MTIAAILHGVRVSGWVRCSVTALAILALSRASSAQNGSVLSGVVQDETGGIIPGAQVVVVNRATSESRQTMTDAIGHFQFTGIPAGDYSLTAEAGDLQSGVLPLTVGAEPVQTTVILKVAKIEEKITVKGATRDPVAADGNVDAVSIDDHLSRTLPTDSATSLIPLLSLFLSPAAQGHGGVSVVIDGVETDRLDLPDWSLKNVTINSNPYSAEQRRPGRGRIEVTTRRGSTANLHGNFALAGRNSIFDARPTFAPTKPQFNQWGLDVGLSGPLPGRRSSFLLTGSSLAKDGSAVVNARTVFGPVNENVPTEERRNRVLARVDGRVTDLQTVRVQYAFRSVTRRNQGVGDFTLPEHATRITEREHTVQVADQAVLLPTLVNDARVGISRADDSTTNTGDGPAVVVAGAFIGGPSQDVRAMGETVLEADEKATWAKGVHLVRIGVNTKSYFIRVSDESNFGGTYRFANLSAFTNKTPFVFQVNRGVGDVSFDEHVVGGFAQVDLRPRPDISWLLGVRYDWQSSLEDRNNVAPRMAVAFAPGDHRTVVRIGAGIFYERLPRTAHERSVLFDGSRIQEQVVLRPRFPMPSGARDATAPLSVFLLAADLATPSLRQASVNIERTLWEGAKVSVGGEILNGDHLFRSRNVNAPLPSTGARPNPQFVNIIQLESSTLIRSRSVSVAFRGRITSRIQATAQYTLSRTIDAAADPFALPADNYDLKAEVGPADFDRRHRFTALSTMHLPSGFRAGVVLELGSGLPFDLTTGFDDNHDGAANDRLAGVTRNTGRGPGLARMDFRFSKLFRAPSPVERHSASRNLQLSVDAFNVLNRANLKNFVGVHSSPFFGRANSAFPGRTVQLSATYRF